MENPGTRNKMKRLFVLKKYFTVAFLKDNQMCWVKLVGFSGKDV